MFNETQKAELQAPLSSAHVKQRAQSGRQLSYIEGWHAIAEANRIFGFDAWSRETIEVKCVAEKEREIGASKAPGWGVTYVARVRVQVGTIVREGCGSGHGIDRDLGQAHESAIKEAETDAMKRALMTFGNPFGLALYDKEQANVSDKRPSPPARNVMKSPSPSAPPVPAANQGSAQEPSATRQESNSAEPEVSDDVLKFDSELATAAEQGVDELKRVWALVPTHLRQSLKGALDRRHKPRAAEVDERR